MSNTRNFLPYHIVEPFNPGYVGVWCFFVISGFLITKLLLDELDETGTISLKDFYFRRALRIFPAMYSYILVIAVLNAFGFIQLTPGDLLHASTYTVNYHNDGTGSWYIGHLWSLSVEEQFYLLWPAVLFFMRRKRAFHVAAAVCFLVPVIRFVIWQWIPGYRQNVLHSFETVADALAMGCLLAGSRDWLWQQQWYRRILTSRWFALMPFIGLGMATLFVRPRTFFLVGSTIGNLALALCIDWAMRFPDTVVGRVLNWRPLVFIGLLSYSLYVWQQLYLNEGRTFNAWWATFPVSLALALGTATLSYYLIEQPCLRLRKKLSRRIRVFKDSAATVA